MIKRTVSIVNHGHIRTENKQMCFRVRGSEEDEVQVPMEDIGLLEVETVQSTITTGAIVGLLESQASIVFCDHTHHPVGVLLPLEGNTLHAERLRLQIEATLPTLKRSWQVIVKAKISNQADVLKDIGINDATVRAKVAKVRSADSTNQEGVAASAYWKEMLRPFGTGRDPDAPYPNNLLNYGYAILRAAVARSIVNSGLHPAIGMKHSNRYNAFSLADDLMEPYRPFIDRHVLPYALEQSGGDDLTPAMKRHILEIMVHDTWWEDGRRPLLNAVARSCSSYVQTLQGIRTQPEFPRICE